MASPAPATSTTTPKTKIQVPSPLPTRRGETYVPRQLRDDVTAALLRAPNAIPSLQNALSTAMTADGWPERVEQYLLEYLRAAESEGRAVRDGELLGLVLRQALRDESKTEGGKLKVPPAAVDAAVKELRKQLDESCVVVDDVDWEGLG